MSYSTTGQVVRHIPGRNFFEAAALGRTIVTVSDLEGFMDDIAYDMDGLLQRLQFSLPVVEVNSPSGYGILANVNALGAAALAEEAWATAKGEVSERAERLRTNYEKLLQQIWDHEIDLGDVGGGPDLPKNIADSGSMDLTSAGATRDHYFTRETEW